MDIITGMLTLTYSMLAARAEFLYMKYMSDAQCRYVQTSLILYKMLEHVTVTIPVTQQLGIGFEIIQTGLSGVKITSADPSMTVAESGIATGDVVVSINGHSTAGIDQDALAAIIRAAGKPGGPNFLYIILVPDLFERAERVSKLVSSCDGEMLDLSGRSGLLKHPHAAQALCSAMLDNRSITSLNVSDCSLGKAGFEALMPMLTGAGAESLVEVNLTGNGIIGDGGQSLVDEVVLNANNGFELTAQLESHSSCLILRKM